MRFLSRAAIGVILGAVTLALLATAVWRAYPGGEDDDAGGRRPGGDERAYVVETRAFEIVDATPAIRAFGEVRAWRTLEIRAAAAGRITAIAPDFRDGAAIDEGAFLFEVDRRAADRAVADAELALAEARADRDEALAARDLARAELQNARAQAALRSRDTERQENLRARNLVSDAVVDDSRLAAAAAEQAALSRRQADLAARTRADNSELAIRRAEFDLENAREALEDVRIEAPFAGRLDEIDATLGRRVAVNERLGVLIDPEALEVAFRVTDREYARLLDRDVPGALEDLAVAARLDLAEAERVISGRLRRAAAVVDSARGGRLLYASLEGPEAAALRPGDFVEVTVFEPMLEGVAVLPLTALDGAGRALVLDDSGERLEEIALEVVRREADRIIVRDPPEGARFVPVRLAHLAAGVRVEKPGGGERPGRPDGGGSDAAPAGNDDGRSDQQRENEGGGAPAAAAAASTIADDAPAATPAAASPAASPEDRPAAQPQNPSLGQPG